MTVSSSMKEETKDSLRILLFGAILTIPMITYIITIYLNNHK